MVINRIIKNYIQSKSIKDYYVIFIFYVVSFILTFYFLSNNTFYINDFYLVLNIIFASSYVILTLNVSYILYKLMSNPQRIINVLVNMSSKKVISYFLLDIVLINTISLVFIILSISYKFITNSLANILLCSFTAGLFPIIVILLLSIDSYIDNYIRLNKKQHHKSIFHSE